MSYVDLIFLKTCTVLMIFYKMCKKREKYVALFGK